MISIKRLILIISLLSFQVFAQPTPERAHPWSLIASMGYGNYQNMYQSDGQTPLGRFGIAVQLANIRAISLGFETGVQSGNHMRLNVTQDLVDEYGGLPFETTLKPMLDLLVTAKSAPSDKIPVILIAKAGITYRQLQFFRETVNNLIKTNAEVQVGFGYQISRYVNLNLLYQHVFGGNPNFRSDPITLKGQISKIPVEQALLLGFSISA
ncbi:MAG: hypothetical protein H0U73_11190 [Tatlockia sp.]|nr:hypothetical protein [Tatlockia sp.]